MSVIDILVIIFYSELFVLMTGLFGLMMDLRKPNLHWQSENVPIKQNGNILLLTFGSWLFCLVVAAGSFFLRGSIPPLLYLIVLSLVFGAFVFLECNWLKTKGTELFDAL